MSSLSRGMRGLYAATNEEVTECKFCTELCVMCTKLQGACRK